MEKKLDQILKKLGEHDKRFDGLEKRMGGLENSFEGTENRFDGLEKQADRTLSLLLDTRTEVRDINKRLVRVESVVETTYDKIDGFLGILKNHSVELTAHASAHRRYEERLDQLEIA